MKNHGKIIGYAFTIISISLTIFALTIYQINDISMVFYLMVRYADTEQKF